MALTTAQLRDNLIAQQQAEAANIVALMESVVDGRLAVVDVDMSALAAKIAAVNELLDGDETTEGFQAFQALVARVLALETSSSEQALLISGLRTDLDASGVRVTDLETTIQEFPTRDELKASHEQSAQAFINRLWVGRTRPAGLPNADGTSSV